MAFLLPGQCPKCDTTASAYDIDQYMVAAAKQAYPEQTGTPVHVLTCSFEAVSGMQGAARVPGSLHHRAGAAGVQRSPVAAIHHRGSRRPAGAPHLRHQHPHHAQPAALVAHPSALLRLQVRSRLLTDKL